jgi:hypothetical protein
MARNSRKMPAHRPWMLSQLLSRATVLSAALTEKMDMLQLDSVYVTPRNAVHFLATNYFPPITVSHNRPKCPPPGQQAIG